MLRLLFCVLLWFIGLKLFSSRSLSWVSNTPPCGVAAFLFHFVKPLTEVQKVRRNFASWIFFFSTFSNILLIICYVYVIVCIRLICISAKRIFKRNHSHNMYLHSNANLWELAFRQDFQVSQVAFTIRRFQVYPQNIFVVFAVRSHASSDLGKQIRSFLKAGSRMAKFQNVGSMFPWGHARRVSFFKRQLRISFSLFIHAAHSH